MSESGRIKFTTVVFLLIFGTASYLGFQVGRAYFEYYQAVEYARDLLKNPYGITDKAIVDRFYGQIVDKTGIPINKGKIRVSQSGRNRSLKFKYSEYITLGKFDVHRFDFYVDEQLNPK